VITIPRIGALALGFGLLVAPLLAHDDDPKILDRTGPVAAPAYRPAAYLPGGSLVSSLGATPGMQAAGGTSFGTQNAVTGFGGDRVAFPSTGVELLSWLPLEELGSGIFSGNDCWGYVSGSGREYGMIGLSTGTAFVDLDDPSDPVVITLIPGPGSLWRDVKIYQHYAYIVSEGGGGIQIIDLAQIDNGIVTHVNSVFSGGTSQTHNVAIDEDSGYLYRCGGASGQGLRIYSLSNPTNPAYVGSWNQRYVHDVQVVTFESGPNSGRQIAYACSGFGNGSTSTGLTILDVTNKNNISVRSQYYYSNAAYSHQAWLSPDRQLLYLNDELDEDGTLPTTTHVIDVSNITSPFETMTFTNGNGSIGHNLYTKGDLIYEANYRSGLRVFDVSSSPVEIASFDTWPGDDHDSFNGLWSCYPYFPSGIVIGSDLERGLFVWWVGAPEVTIDPVGAIPDVLHPAGDTTTVQIGELAAGDLSVGSERLYYDIGAGIVEVPLVSLGGGTYEVPFPALPCGTEIEWFLGARSTTGILWTTPSEAPYNSFGSLVAENEQIAFYDDMESDLGWTVGAPDDDAIRGVWARADPQEGVATPEDDVSTNGTLCWLTGVSSDVDHGTTTLTSPSINVNGWSDPIVSFWLWFVRDGMAQGTDDCLIEISNDGGQNWTLMERIQFGSHYSVATWMRRAYHVADFIAPTATISVRFRVTDDNLETDVEAMVDEFKVSQAACGCSSSSYCSVTPNSTGSAALISSTGSTLITSNDFGLSIAGAVPGNAGLFFYGSNQAQLPLGDGFLCVTGGSSGIIRLQPPVQIDGAGNALRPIDFSAPPASSGPGAIIAGSTWNFQFWYRDPAGGPAGSNLSDGLSVVFCP